MEFDTQTQAILLLTVYLGKPEKEDQRPLSPSEWGRFAAWLQEHDASPGDLLTEDPVGVLTHWDDKKVSLDRIRYLVNRAAALGLALEKWGRAGLWILTRSHGDYPARLRKRLRAAAPPVLFGCGNRRLLNEMSLGVVGARDAASDDLEFSAYLGQEAAQQGLTIVSGGARGVDEMAMQGALGSEGTAIGVLADSLLRMATATKYRQALLANDLVLISPFHPEAGFEVGNAMARNKYIYCLAGAVIAVSTSLRKGGTWHGAIENLEHRWVPLWVKGPADHQPGNAELVRRGARWLPEGAFELVSLLASETLPGTGQLELAPEPVSVGSGPGPAPAASAGGVDRSPESSPNRKSEPGVTPPDVAGATSATVRISFYELFLSWLRELTAESPMTLDDLAGHLDINRAQITAWLSRALKEGQVQRLLKPARYRARTDRHQQGSIFEDVS